MFAALLKPHWKVPDAISSARSRIESDPDTIIGLESIRTTATEPIVAGRQNCRSVLISRLVDANELIKKVASWSKRDDRVIAAGICGSYAQGDTRPDSDIDFCILTSDPDSLLKDRLWITGFGSDARVAGAVEDYNLVQSIRVFYGETEAEFGVTDQAWMELPIDHETAGVMNDGLRILYDPAGRLERAVAFAASLSQ